MLAEFVAREGKREAGAGAGDRGAVTPADVLEAARDDGGATCLHMAAANGHSSEYIFLFSIKFFIYFFPFPRISR